MPKPDLSRLRVSISEITSDGFIELDDLPHIDFIGHEWDFRFGEADWDKFLVLMVKSSSISPNAECMDACTDGLSMKSKRKSDGEYCDIYICRQCSTVSMAEQPETVLGEEWL